MNRILTIDQFKDINKYEEGIWFGSGKFLWFIVYEEFIEINYVYHTINKGFHEHKSFKLNDKEFTLNTFNDELDIYKRYENDWRKEISKIMHQEAKQYKDRVIERRKNEYWNAR